MGLSVTSKPRLDSCPSISAAGMARPETPLVWIATDESVSPESSSCLSNRWTSGLRSRVKIFRGSGQIAQLPHRFRRDEARASHCESATSSPK